MILAELNIHSTWTQLGMFYKCLSSDSFQRCVGSCNLFFFAIVCQSVLSQMNDNKHIQHTLYTYCDKQQSVWIDLEDAIDTLLTKHAFHAAAG